MKKEKTYSEKLKDPRWQKKRLEILQRDGFKCQSCTSDTETLHVHHLRYDSNCEPWEYENEDLITLCESCHEAISYLQAKKDMDIVNFILVCKLLDRLEQESIDKFLNKHYQNV